MKPHEIAGTLEPMLAPSKIVGIDIPFEELHFPYYVSTKFNGIRGVVLNGEFKSRAMKPLNLHYSILRYLDPILQYASNNKLVLDGELHSYVENTVGGTVSILAGKKHMPYDFCFRIFGIWTHEQWHGVDGVDSTIKTMLANPHWENIKIFSPKAIAVQQSLVLNQYELDILLDEAKQLPKVEGLMFLSPYVRLFHGRCSDSVRTFLKLKFYTDPIDAKIINVTSRMERNSEVEMVVNENTCRAQQVYSKELFHNTTIAGALVVKLEDGTICSIPFPVGTSMQMRSLWYKHFGQGGSFDIKDRWVSFRKLATGEKDKPQAIKCVEFRDAKD